MEVKCPGCGSHASQVLVGSDERHYAKCLECGEIQLLEPKLPQVDTNGGSMIRQT
jgi:ribosomal protein S27E